MILLSRIMKISNQKPVNWTENWELFQVNILLLFSLSKISPVKFILPKLSTKIIVKNLVLNLNSTQGPFVNYVSIQGYLVGQQNAYFSKQTLFNKHAYLRYLLGQKQANICLRNLRTAPYKDLCTCSRSKRSKIQMLKSVCLQIAAARFSVVSIFFS